MGVEQIMNEEEINKMCCDIYEGEDWQPMKDYIKSLQTQLQQKENIIKEFENKGYDIAQERADFLLKIKELENIIEEDKKIEKVHECFTSTDNKEIQFLIDNINQLGKKVNEIIDKINEDK